MTKCNICEKEVKKVFTCKRCKAKFCEKDGEIETEICEDCFGLEDEEKQEESDIIHDVQELGQEEHE